MKPSETRYLVSRQRCRDLLTIYAGLGPAGRFGYTVIEAALRRADAAVMSGDVATMMRSLEELRGCE